MRETLEERKQRDLQEDLARLRGLCPIDDDFMHYELFRETTRFYKENPKGVEIMCRAFEEVRDEAKEQERIDNIRNIMMNLKLSVQQAMDELEIPVSDQAKYSKALSL